VIFIFIEPTCKRGLTLAVDGWVGTARRAHNRLKDDTDLLISVGRDTGHSFATGYTKTADHDAAKRGDWYRGRWWVGCYIWNSEEG